MSRNFTIAPGEFYHIYNRGVDKRTVYTNKADYERFLALLYVSNSLKPVHLQLQGSTLKEVLEIEREKTLVDISAYCLMPNHFHILVKEKEEGGISKFMQKVTTGYTMYFNTRYERSGSLFQGRFRASHANRNEYLKYLIAYIHLNPVKLIDPQWKERGTQDLERTNKYLQGYNYSSFVDYSGQERIEGKLLNKTVLPEYFPRPEDFMSEIAEWLTSRLNLEDSKMPSLSTKLPQRHLLQPESQDL